MRRSSTETKAVILSSARERFAADGYDRATIRSIAADAAIDPAMVMRYYGTKERLFAASVEFDLELPNLAMIERERIGNESHDFLPDSGCLRSRDETASADVTGCGLAHRRAGQPVEEPGRRETTPSVRRPPGHRPGHHELTARQRSRRRRPHWRATGCPPDDENRACRRRTNPLPTNTRSAALPDVAGH
ncbi:TetR family transcriptional regulator [Nocardia sp. NBC_00881]|uniref:TetR family transcriptional regulator n=1 Tax=Nocardia sp. NBC_00881 TaxID=2975995 RepID=UPI003863C45C|nr:TetR family transcriptional regulator [Nocardia sp. NBC_00881]